MNAPAPPKEAGGTVNAAHSKLTLTPILPLLRATIKRGWQREAARLFNEFWRNGNQKHLVAFVTHVAAIRVYAKRATR